MNAWTSPRATRSPLQHIGCPQLYPKTCLQSYPHLFSIFHLSFSPSSVVTPICLHVRTLCPRRPTPACRNSPPYAAGKAQQDQAWVLVGLSLPLPLPSHAAAATLVSLLSLHLAWHTATSGPLHFFFFSCLDLAFFKSLGISLSHLLSSLFPCVLWDAPYTLLKNPHLSFTISSLLSFFSFKFVTWSTKYLYIVLFTYFIVCPHTPLEYSFCKGRILF